MQRELTNFLYENPALYDIVLQARHVELVALFQRFVEKFLPNSPTSLLDIGCGTARYLEPIARMVSRCVAIDLNDRMIAHARDVVPGVDLRVGDMRKVWLDEHFDAVVSFGSTISYALSEGDLQQTLSTYRRHMADSSRLLLSCWNASAFLGNSSLLHTTRTYDFGSFQAIAKTKFSFERGCQQLVRERAWTFSDGRACDDYCTYRMLFPAEIECRFGLAGLNVLGIFDDLGLESTSLEGRGMYIIASIA